MYFVWKLNTSIGSIFKRFLCVLDLATITCSQNAVHDLNIFITLYHTQIHVISLLVRSIMRSVYSVYIYILFFHYKGKGVKFLFEDVQKEIFKWDFVIIVQYKHLHYYWEESHQHEFNSSTCIDTCILHALEKVKIKNRITIWHRNVRVTKIKANQRGGCPIFVTYVRSTNINAE